MVTPSLLKLLYLVSPALPIGAYAYSQGQEYAVDGGWLDGEAELSDWILGVMRHSVGTTDLPVLLRCYRAWECNDASALNEWNDLLIATRETKELLLEDEQLGMGLVRVLETHGFTRHQDQFHAKPSFATLFALAGQQWQIPIETLMHGFLWSWLENQVAAATKTVPLGQTQAQRIMMALMDSIPEITKAAMQVPDESIGAGLPGLAMASCLHERQYSRLFRS